MRQVPITSVYGEFQANNAVRMKPLFAACALYHLSEPVTICPAIAVSFFRIYPMFWIPVKTI